MAGLSLPGPDTPEALEGYVDGERWVLSRHIYKQPEEIKSDQMGGGSSLEPAQQTRVGKSWPFCKQ